MTESRESPSNNPKIERKAPWVTIITIVISVSGLLLSIFVFVFQRSDKKQTDVRLALSENLKMAQKVGEIENAEDKMFDGVDENKVTMVNAFKFLLVATPKISEILENQDVANNDTLAAKWLLVKDQMESVIGAATHEPPFV